MARVRPILPPLLGILGIAAVLMLTFGDARLLNYDTSYSLLWGSELAAGQIPDLTVKYAPTQHPLATLLGALLTLPGLGDAPFGETATAIWELLGILFLGRPRLARICTRARLVRDWRGSRGGTDRADPRAGAELRRAGVRRHSLPVPAARRAARRDTPRASPARRY